MRRVTFTAVFVAVLMVSAPAGAATLVRADGRPIPRLQAWLDTAPVPTIPGQVRVLYGQNATHYDPATRTIHVRAGRKLTRPELLHEMGHEFERIGLTDAGFAEWAAMVGHPYPRNARMVLPGGERWVSAEFFADFYTGCATRGRALRRDGAYVVSPQGARMLRSTARAACQRIYRLDVTP
jgi:hypothetical protein